MINQDSQFQYQNETQTKQQKFEKENDSNKHKSGNQSILKDIGMNQSKKQSKYSIPYQTKSKCKTQMAMTLINGKNNYVNFYSPKDKPQISRMSFPYFLEDDIISQPQKQKENAKQIKIYNRVMMKSKQQSYFDDYNFMKINSEQPPVNEFLCYDLSKDINDGLFEVKVLAQQIKKIKRDKQQAIEDKQKYRPTNKIRIKRTFKGNFGLIKGSISSWNKREEKTIIK